MRLADVVFRRGHLSESALVDAWSSGARPAHLDRCDICAERALEMSHWLDDVKALGRADAETVFTPERLTAQRGQILQRLEQLDRPAKVISFPARKKQVSESVEHRRVNPAWLAAAAAAGLTLGIVGVELGHTLGFGATPPEIVASATVPQPLEVTPSTGTDASAIYDDPYSRTELRSVSALDEMTPRLVDVMAINR